ncbi:MAG: phosphoribosyltransferase [Candidatus Methanomethylicia archaeon]|jgi:hypoxanthine phosphoribosyltransferase|uniref:Phosphoribosyltransferase n=1 Tax=Thermoproteota archaeon TaxID=2056631 RepID=A0A523B9K8_9CREN|nr:phosphoribosyltransferase [Candidatus Methanomethylicia archaeon]MCQ5340825.1 phosphoribosyltransferase [Candidatus Methanomethylicia archaeon]NHV45369.1 phosphoribosyltransferase [Candidatus Verstraetearchaeota archaeon]RZN56673.1 MAG: phosphoribosyltransferase [Candidatus Verstraetearchaeota archaeon]TDA37626.1 MAG: phosphoribosyltransferase [Candidatus Verstraetearchaeota archaeon]
MKILVVDWNKIQSSVLSLANKILNSKYHPDMIVGIARGGWIVARLLSDLLSIKNLASLRIEFYKGIGKKDYKPIITQPISEPPDGKSVLIVDDVVDSGESMNLAKQYIVSMGAKDVKIATIHMKPWSKITPDYYVEIVDAWIIYPWEIRESIEQLINMWKEESKESIRDKLISIGIPKEYIDLVI